MSWPRDMVRSQWGIVLFRANTLAEGFPMQADAARSAIAIKSRKIVTQQLFTLIP